MGAGSSGGVPLGAGKGVPTVPMGNGASSPNVAAPTTYRPPSQYTQPFQQYRPPQQMQFSMPAPPQRQQQMSSNNLAGIMGVTNLGQQQQMSRPNYPNPTSIAQLQAMYGTRGPSGGPPQQQPMTGRSDMSLQEINIARNALGLPPLQQQQPPQQPQQQYFRPQQYQQDPYMNYVQNQQQALQQRAIQSANMQNAQQNQILQQQQAAQAAQVAQRAAAQGSSYTPEPFVPQ